MRRSCRINDVVPIVEGLVKDDLSIESGLEMILNFSSSLIVLADDSREYPQTGLCSGSSGSFASIFNRE